MEMLLKELQLLRCLDMFSEAVVMPGMKKDVMLILGSLSTMQLRYKRSMDCLNFPNPKGLQAHKNISFQRVMFEEDL